MKRKTCELMPGLLDAAVAKCEGLEFQVRYEPFPDGAPTIQVLVTRAPSTDWVHGGPIIEREKIAVSPASWTEWSAGFINKEARGSGPTMLIAAMRAFVASKLGDEVMLP